MTFKYTIRYLFHSGMEEISSFYLHFCLIFLFALLIERCRNPKVRLALAFLPVMVQLFFVRFENIRSDSLIAFMLAFLISASMAVLRLIPFAKTDYLIIMAVLLFPRWLFNSSYAFFSETLIFAVIFSTVYIAVFFRLKSIRGNMFYCYFLSVILSLLAFMYRSCVDPLRSFFLKMTGSSPLSVCMAVLSLISILLAAVWSIRHFLAGRLARINQMGRRYPKIERYFSYLSLAALLLFILLYLPFTLTDSQNPLIRVLLPVFCLTILIMQIFFMILLYQTAFFKDTSAFAENSMKSLSAYYSDLTNNITSMQEIRHDIKNIFFTMGNYVNRNDDPEMQAFFWEKIYPYANGTIQQNELFSRLYQIPFEPLQAFLYLKLTQAMSRKVTVHLDLHIQAECFQAGMEIIDLTRILGILLDNALEEAEKAEHFWIDLKISNNRELISYVVKNPVTEETRKNGIHAGLSSKGEGHGNGLLIVQQLMNQYPEASLNSCFSEEKFVQSLNLIYQGMVEMT